MSTITVLKFDTPAGADDALALVRELHRDSLLKLHDAAVVFWPIGKKRPLTSQVRDLTGESAVKGMFCGLLIGLIFSVPLSGIALGMVGAMFAALRNSGIDEDFLKWVRANVTEGTSALFLLTSDAAEADVIDRIKGLHAEIVATNLSKQQRQKLVEAFGQN
jgi:uncharacterized membrane protein